MPMNPIHGVDDHTAFFPVKLDTSSIGRIAGNEIDGSTPDSAAGDSEFHNILQALMKRFSNGSGPDQPNSPGEITGMTAAGNKTDGLLLVLDKIKQSGGSGAESGQQIDTQQVIKSLMNLKTPGAQNSAEPISSMPYSGMITRYRQAMQDFRAAFNLEPPVTPDSTNVHPMNRILNGETGIVQNIANTSLQGMNPSKDQVIGYITEQCKQMGVPVKLGLATAATESDMTQFAKDGTPFRNSNPDSTDWGIMQVNDKAWGDTYDFNRIKSDWQYNVRAGLQILKSSFDTAVKTNEGGQGTGNPLDNLARAAYSGYNAGTENIWRYRTPVENAANTHLYDVVSNEGYDVRDIRFWNNYQKL